jgi:hypothetical protein
LMGIKSLVGKYFNSHIFTIDTINYFYICANTLNY